jgi:hypothetical protein
MRVAISVQFLLIVSLACGQVTIDGSVRSGTYEPLGDVNIGIWKKDIWTVSDEKGYFSITVKELEVNDSISFSHVGYEERKCVIKDLLKTGGNEIVLTRKNVLLREVVVQPERSKRIELGTRSYVAMVAGHVKRNGDINEYAKLIRIKKRSRMIDVNINVFNVRVDSASFEIGIYDVDDGLPHGDVDPRRIIVHTELVDGWNKISLEEYDLDLCEPIYLSIKYLPGSSEEPEPFRYSGHFIGGSASRTARVGGWRRSKGLTIAMFVTVER